jgi:hypothetical protein
VQRNSAFLNGRDVVSDDAIQLLADALWENPTQVKTVERACTKVSNPIAEKALQLLYGNPDDKDDPGLEGMASRIRDAKGLALDTKGSIASELNGKIKIIVREINDARQQCIPAGHGTTKSDEVADRLNAVRRSIFVGLLDMDAKESSQRSPQRSAARRL